MTSKPGSEIKVILFDEHDTLLDMRPLRARVNRIFGSDNAYALWFQTLLHYTVVENVTGQHHPLVEIAAATMKMTSRSLGTAAAKDATDEVFELMKQLPLNEDVQNGLSDMSRHYRMAVLTNTPRNIIGQRMERTGLISYFETIFSAEDLSLYKPAKETYLMAVEKMEVDPEQVLMITAYAWDVCGAHNAGIKTAFINEADRPLYPLAVPPTFVAENLEKLAQAIAEYNREVHPA